MPSIATVQFQISSRRPSSPQRTTKAPHRQLQQEMYASAIQAKRIALRRICPDVTFTVFSIDVTRRRLIAIGLALWVVLPTALFKPSNHFVMPVASVGLHHLYIFAWFISAVAHLRKAHASGFLQRLLANAAGLHYSAVYSLMAYRLYTGHPFDAMFALHSWRDAPSTLVAILGWKAIPVLLFTVSVWLGSSWLIARMGRLEIWTFSIRPGIAFVALTCCLFLLPDSSSYIGQSSSNLLTAARYQAFVLPVYERLELFPDASSEENVFFLQLESVNAVAALGKAVVGGRKYSDIYVPNLVELSRNGVLFPFAWGNTIQTGRSAEAVLCGLTNNIGAPLSYRPDAITNPCLPELLRKKHFSTTYFNGYYDPTFHNLADFAQKKGFDDVLGPEITSDQTGLTGFREHLTTWGFNECTFFSRVFKYLKEQHPHPKRLFVHVAVSRNHHPFTDRIGSRTAFFTNPQNFIEGYLNSLGEQDACLNQFWTEFNAFAGQNSHLFVFGDHSWPVGINGSTFNEEGSRVENFSIPILYVPPQQRSGEMRIGTRPDTMIGQADIPSTVLDLLRIGTGTNSFAPILRGVDHSGYEECQILVQPYGERAISVTKDRTKYTYELSSGTLTRSDLSRSLLDENPIVVAKGMSYDRFNAEYGCRRYQTKDSNPPMFNSQFSIPIR